MCKLIIPLFQYEGWWGFVRAGREARKATSGLNKLSVFISRENLSIGLLIIGIYQQNHRHKNHCAQIVQLIQPDCTCAVQEILFLSCVKECCLFMPLSIIPTFLKICNAAQVLQNMKVFLCCLVGTLIVWPSCCTRRNISYQKGWASETLLVNSGISSVVS